MGSNNFSQTTPPQNNQQNNTNYDNENGCGCSPTFIIITLIIIGIIFLMCTGIMNIILYSLWNIVKFIIILGVLFIAYLVICDLITDNENLTYKQGFHMLLQGHLPKATHNHKNTKSK